MTNKILLIQAGSPPDAIIRQHGDLNRWFKSALAPLNTGIDVVAPFRGEKLPEPHQHKIAIITGSWSMVTESLDWSENLADWIRQAVAADMPLFGICYGHQLMSHALGGKVDYHPNGREVGSQQIFINEIGRSDPWLKSSSENFWAHLTHLQTVFDAPPQAKVLGHSKHDAKQIIRYSDYAVSTQFHPEITVEIADSLIDFRAKVLAQEDICSTQLKAELRESPIASQLFLSFVRQFLTP